MLDTNGSTIKISHVDLRKTKGFFEMCDKVKAELLTYPEPELILVEEPVMSFSAKASSAATIGALQAFNGAIRLLVWETWRKPVESISCVHARKVLCIDTKLKKGLTPYHRKKELKKKIIEWCITQDPGLDFEKTKQENWQVWCGDRADAYVMARFGNERTTKDP